LGRRLHARQHAPPASRCCGGAPAVEGLQSRAGCTGASLRRRCSTQSAQTAGAVGVRDDGLLNLIGTRPQHYKHSAQSCVGGALMRVAAGAAVAGVSPHHAPGH
jgi:hypothetical protein